VSVVDANGRPLREGDWIEIGDRMGTFLGFERGWPEVAEDPTGEIMVEIDGDEERLTTFFAGGSDACYDIEKLR
jgi:hypothetical protein